MRYWDTAGDDDRSEIASDFAGIWQALPKVVFSRSLMSVEGSNTTLAQAALSTELRALTARTAGDITIGGGRPLFAQGHNTELELIESRTFSSRVVYLRYDVSSAD